MSNHVKRLRIFGGPNGSGKSTIIEQVKLKYFTGQYLNADEIEKACREKGFIKLDDFGLNVKASEFDQFLYSSSLKEKAIKDGFDVQLTLVNNIIKIAKKTHSYEAALISEFLRQQLLKSELTFSFETVMSHSSKLEILKQANALGYKTYLYFVATESPDINIKRVRNRVKKGGHNVPNDKIIERYHRSLSLLAEVIPHTYRSYIFDNSGQSYRLISEIEQGHEILLKDSNVPNWFRTYVLDKLT